ncbi:MAG: adenosylcobinamide-GDP ribazoletransferase [Spirochaetales bacterium]|nr:adenosylcobinamide-GDP ribazoletransferase [Spirochaetales bacterium]
MIRKLFYAIRFMTSLPLPWKENEDLVQVSRSSGMFPMVGLIIGFLLLGIQFLSSLVFGDVTTALMQTAAWVFITGGLHLDGLADTVDGIGSRRDRERMLEIMKDSHIGAFGVLALILQILLKTALCYELNRLDPLLILLVPLSARWGQLIVIRAFKPARKDGMGRFFQEHMRAQELLIGFMTVLGVYILSGNSLYLPVLPVHGLIVYLTGVSISRKLGGLTGDVYGFVCETGEDILLLLILINAGLMEAFAFQIPSIF